MTWLMRSVSVVVVVLTTTSSVVNCNEHLERDEIICKNYLDGMYQHTTGDILGVQAVKIIGWDTENDTDYWLVANSWNRNWGDEGFFKFIIGTDVCDFEVEMVAGYPYTP